MFDFSTLAKAPQSDLPASLAELFGQLDRKATHTSLRPAQAAAAQALDLQIDQHDIVMKLSTGSGKTVLGLLYAERMRRRYKGEPVVYLCPTTQLVDQVVAAGKVIGVGVSTFGQDGLPYEALGGEAVLACTYDKLFTARTVFESRSIRPSTFVLDDCHAGIERVKQSFTANIPRECYGQVRALLKPLCEGSDAATWRGIERDDQGSTYEVPYWIWNAVHKEICAIFEKHKDSQDLRFNWDNISRYAELARFCISGIAAEISLSVPPVEENSAYQNARHRLFMSASVKDGSALIGVLACDPAAFSRVIEPTEDDGAGERMMLPTSLINNKATKEEIATLCGVLSKQANVVVLTSSAAQARTWQDAGAVLSQGKEVDVAIDRLRNSNQNYTVFAQRFDGVDLADDACRILVLDGIPSGDRVCDHIDSYRQKDSPGYEVRTVNRFEQALGRAVRSSADYAAVLLVGTDIAAFIGKKTVSDLLEARTRVQVELGKELAKQTGDGKPIATIVSEMAQALLHRNEGWKDAHRVRVKAVPRMPRLTGLTAFEEAAVASRAAWEDAKARNFQSAVAKLREASNIGELHKIQKAEIIYLVSSYLHQFDPGAAADAYRAVFSMNVHFPRPEKVADKKFVKMTEQAVSVRDFFSTFNAPNAAIARLDEIKAKLVYANSAEIVEQGLLELGTALGATASRPEKETGRGPDVLWLFDDCAACVEAKNEKTAPIHKTDAAQLSLSLEWCREQVELPGGVACGIFATNVTQADRPEDISFGPRLINQDLLMQLVERLRQLVLSLTFDGPLFTDPPAVGKKLAEMALTGKQILGGLPVMKG